MGLLMNGKNGTSRQLSLLKVLREKKRISRTELSKRTKLSTYQVEGLEGKGASSLLSKIFLCTQALGYKTQDILSLMDSEHHGSRAAIVRGSLDAPQSEMVFREGVKMLTYHQGSSSFFGQIQIKSGQSINRSSLPAGDVVLGVVQEGALVLDVLLKQMVYKKDQFFLFAGGLPVEFLNADIYTQVSALLFILKYPQ